ncbi:Heterokaryon incompatibility [Cordyceps fumosorosea ARSEF 2679]|uniref:Heterokaryon incompatibility n=1 Tax=Cordyceps fumosorosea (strain ARSEF 2679) TaxID=1081104 RepID=A0A168BB68_CORFA|nr:Heterokaryon incompatibility [Cordyceps fumosorosea ARSEF 2679]OAA69876.1 Heterokaryon incompatibility [Cordyceps fumosorosea ARSEF 2679]
MPGAFADDIHVELEPVSIPSDGSNLPRYEALSYVWGTVLPEEPKILVKDRDEPADAQPRYLTVRENLRCALQHLRSESAVRTLWIDAICINQDDEVEKSTQVAHMGSIYELAERVVIWFGPAVDGSAEVVALLSKLALLARYDFRKDLLSWTTGDAPPEDLMFAGKDLESLILGVSNTWFDRVWTLQELGVTDPDMAIIQWGPQTVPFVHLQTAIIVYQSFYVDRDQDRDGSTAALRRRWSARRGNVLIFLMARFFLGFDFDSAMETVRYRDCYDPRDRIYAVLRLCRPRLDVVPDYGPACTAAALFERVCLRQLQDGVDLLGSCEWPNGMAGLPSWVPNWHAKRAVHAYFVGHSLGLLRNQYRQETPGELICWGNKFADITDVLDLRLSPASSNADVCAAVEKVLTWVTKDVAIDLNVLTHVAFALFPEGILEFTFPMDVDPANGLVPMREAFNFLRSFLPGDQQNTGEEDAKKTGPHQVSPLIARCIRERFTGRCLVKTSSGSFGSVLNSATVGDQIFALPGCRHSIVLRHVKEKRFRVVGSGFVTSNMAGEGLLGPLLGMGMREVRLTLEGGFGYVGFFGGRPFRTDARIEMLYSKTEAGAGVRPGDQVLIADMYKAVTVDVLRKNGVELEEITLF